VSTAEASLARAIGLVNAGRPAEDGALAEQTLPHPAADQRLAG